MLSGAAISTILASIVVPSSFAQASMRSVHRLHSEHYAIPDLTQWSLSKGPHPNVFDNLVFETVYSLLQFWPNIRMRNGHNIVPGKIPCGTLLYHGTDHKEIPSGPQWVALDPEHSYNFCGNSSMALGYSQQGCFHLTLTTTRPLKVVYFDGKSAAKLPDGPLDTQDLLAWGGLRPEYMWDETRRIQDLCAWGEKFGVDGFVRMEVAFEVMLCDFASDLSVVSFLEIVATSNLTRTVFESLNAGSWHNRFPGETRVQLDLAGLVSFYDTRLVPSLVAIRAGQERWDHRAGNTSSEDIATIKSRLEAALVRPSDLSSGIDWRTLFQVIVDRFSGRLELTRYLLNSSTTDPKEILDIAYQVHTQLRIMLTPYLLSSAMPTGSLDETDLDWSNSIFKLCATAHTKFSESNFGSMTDSEELLLQALQGTSREICRVVTKMWATGVCVGVDPSLNTNEFPEIVEVTRLWGTWVEDLDGLMTWLDWNVWIKCNPSCGPEEICHLHKWPARFGPQGGLRTVSMERSTGDVRGTVESYRPQPRCISLVEP